MKKLNLKEFTKAYGTFKIEYIKGFKFQFEMLKHVSNSNHYIDKVVNKKAKTFTRSIISKPPSSDEKVVVG